MHIGKLNDFKLIVKTEVNYHIANGNAVFTELINIIIRVVCIAGDGYFVCSRIFSGLNSFDRFGYTCQNAAGGNGKLAAFKLRSCL